MLHAVEKTFLVAQPVQLVALCKSRGMLPWLKASRLKLAAKAVEQGGSRRLLKEKKFSPGRRA